MIDAGEIEKKIGTNICILLVTIILLYILLFLASLSPLVFSILFVLLFSNMSLKQIGEKVFEYALQIKQTKGMKK